MSGFSLKVGAVAPEAAQHMTSEGWKEAALQHQAIQDEAIMKATAQAGTLTKIAGNSQEVSKIDPALAAAAQQLKGTGIQVG